MPCYAGYTAKAEVKRCAEIFGIETEVLDIHDGEIMPTLENRMTMVRLIREQLKDWYGPDRGERIRYAEAFEICEYGRRPSRQEIKKLFPFYAN